MKKKTLLTAILSIVMCLSLMAGATFALFTSESKVNIAITSGKVQVTAYTRDLETSSFGVANQTNGVFDNGGTASINGNEVFINKITPGDKVTFKVDVKNHSSIAAKYTIRVTNTENDGLADALNVSFIDQENNEISMLSGVGFTPWALIEGADEYAENPDLVKTITVSIEFPNGTPEHDNLYQDKACKFEIAVYAVQGNATTADPFTKVGEREYNINTEEGMELVGALANTNFHGEGVKLVLNLTNDLDMTNYTWPTEYNEMWIKFNGNGHVISNATINNWRAGFFGYAGGSELHDITLKNFNVTGAQAGIIAGSADGTLAKNVIIDGVNNVNFKASYQHNNAEGTLETWNAIGAVYGLSFGNTRVEGVEIASGAVVNVNYNDMVTDPGCRYRDSDIGVFINDYIGNVQVNGQLNKNGVFYYGATPATVNTILANAQAGDTIMLTAGDYGVITLPRNVDYGNARLTIKGSDGAVVDGVDLNAADGVILDGITFDAAGAFKKATTYYTSINFDDSGVPTKNTIIKNCVFNGEYSDPANYNAICVIAGGGDRANTITVDNCKFNCNAFNYIRFDNVRDNVTITNNTFGGDGFATGHHSINMTGYGASVAGKNINLTITGNKFNNWNPKKNAFASSHTGQGFINVVITDNVFSNTSDFMFDGSDWGGVFELKSSYIASNHTLDFSNNTYAGALSAYTDAIVLLGRVNKTFTVGSTEYTYTMTKAMANSVEMFDHGAYSTLPEVVQSVNVYSTLDMNAFYQMCKDGKVVPNTNPKDWKTTINMMADIDFGGNDWASLTNKNIIWNGNGYTFSNLNILANSNGQAGLFGKAGNITINDLTLKDVTATGYQVGAFFGNGEVAKLINCKLAGNITINWTSNGSSANAAGAAVGCFSYYGVDKNIAIVSVVDGANIVINNTGITYHSSGVDVGGDLIDVLYNGAQFATTIA